MFVSVILEMAPMKTLDKPWSKAEDEEVLALVHKHGRKWRLIAAAMPGRSYDALGGSGKERC